jgi:hypothetical protein
MKENIQLYLRSKLRMCGALPPRQLYLHSTSYKLMERGLDGMSKQLKKIELSLYSKMKLDKEKSKIHQVKTKNDIIFHYCVLPIS